MSGPIEFLHALGAETISGFWAPLLAWTVLALITAAVLHVWRSAHPLVQYAGRMALLVALPAGMLAAWAVDLPIGAWWGGDASAMDPMVSNPPSGVAADAPVVTEGSSPALTLETWFPLFGVLTIVVAVAALSATVWMIRSAVLLLRMRRLLLERPVPRTVHEAVIRRAKRRGINRPIRVVVTDMNVPPMTFGFRRPVMVLPQDVLEDEEALHMSISHEIVHIGRCDDLFHKTELLIGSLFIAHPAVGWLRRSIAYYRELACDAAVLEQPDVSRRCYAALLYRFATTNDPYPDSALNMYDKHPQLMRRIIAMKDHPQTFEHSVSPRRTALVLAFTLLAATTLLISCTDSVAPRTQELAADEAAPPESASDDMIFVIVEDMPELVGGPSALESSITYTEAARQAGAEGTVIVQATVDSDGSVSNAAVLQGVGYGLDEEVLRAVRTARFEPGLQRGKPVDVRMSIPVRFASGEAPSVRGVGMRAKRMDVQELKAEDDAVSGRVVSSETGQPLPGANVVLKGTTTGAASGPDGRFSIKLSDVSESAPLTVSYVGYETVDVNL